MQRADPPAFFPSRSRLPHTTPRPGPTPGGPSDIETDKKKLRIGRADFDAEIIVPIYCLARPVAKKHQVFASGTGGTHNKIVRLMGVMGQVRRAGVDPKATFKIGPRNGREARESGLWRPAVPRRRDYGAGVQVLGLRTASTTSRIAAMTSSGWSWWMLCPLLVAMA